MLKDTTQGGKRKRRPTTKRKAALAAALEARGYTRQRIAKAMGVCGATIFYYLGPKSSIDREGER